MHKSAKSHLNITNFFLPYGFSKNARLRRFLCLIDYQLNFLSYRFFILDWKNLYFFFFIIVDSTIFCALDINCSLSNCDKVAVHCVKITKMNGRYCLSTIYYSITAAIGGISLYYWKVSRKDLLKDMLRFWNFKTKIGLCDSFLLLF